MPMKFTSHSPAETERLAARLSLWVRPGFLIRLAGDLGSGKSTFARAFIREMAANLGRGDFDIPSPTFTLVQSYSETRLPVFHADLYRLKSAADVEELGLGELLSTHVGLVEWPELLPVGLSPDVLTLCFSGSGEVRGIDMVAEGAWVSALQRDAQIEAFLGSAATRHFLEGDASARRYEWLEDEGGSNPLLMDMPTRPDGPPVRHGKPYSAIAHLAEGLPAVVAMNGVLGERGYSAPKVLRHDLESGLALIENLGSRVYGKMLVSGEDMTEPMLAAAGVLADMARHNWPSHVSVADGISHQVRPYDADALLIEADLLPSWFWPYLHGRNAAPDVNASFEAVWRTIIPYTEQVRPQWVLRDYHSPNLLWIPERKGLQRVGLIDTQDAVMGHAAYDLASLTQDARVDIPGALVQRTISHYLDLRKREPGFSAEDFMTAYAVLGAQRATKILGIFARLSKRDGKHGYLRHMPRVSWALAKNLEHPVLRELKQWYLDHLPEALKVKA